MELMEILSQIAWQIEFLHKLEFVLREAVRLSIFFSTYDEDSFIHFVLVKPENF